MRIGLAWTCLVFLACVGAGPFVDMDGDGVAASEDCDDHEPRRAPNLREVCDGLDNDCDGVVPDRERDEDRDGNHACLDCDDHNPSVYLNAPELCDDLDNDCDGLLGPGEVADQDGDGYTLCGGDCNDEVASAYPGGIALCDGIDNDCDFQLEFAEEDFTGDGVLDCDIGACAGSGRNGTTWTEVERIDELGVSYVGCVSDDHLCDRFQGDSVCDVLRPLLCVREVGLPNPGVAEDWSGHETRLTKLIAGCQLSTPAAADDICYFTFGEEWRAGRHEDGGSSLGYWAEGYYKSTGERFWVTSALEGGNCAVPL